MKMKASSSWNVPRERESLKSDLRLVAFFLRVKFDQATPRNFVKQS